MNKVVARFADGRLLKGATGDFFPAKDVFHVIPMGTTDETKAVPVRVSELKALFFVKDLHGDPSYDERKEFDVSQPVVGRRLRVVFKDGEVLVGTTTGYQRSRPGFFLEPADGRSNNERCYVVTAATREVSFL